MIADSLKTLMASTFAFYLKAHGFQLNVEGEDFPQLHKFFKKIYKDAFDSVDDYGEFIRALDEYAPGSLKRMMDLSQVDDQPRIPNAKLMVEELLSDNDKIMALLVAAIDEAENEDEDAVADFLADRQERHGKWHWQLGSYLK